MHTFSGKWATDRHAGYAHWAADNGCYTAGDSFDLDAYLAWLPTLPHRDRCLFATAPDVVGDARATWERSKGVLPMLRALRYKAAFVAQDGLALDSLNTVWRVLPDGTKLTRWDAFDCLFIGGTTAYKLSESAFATAREAKRRGKHIHMGRVNTFGRLRAAVAAGFDSADGTYIKYGPDINLPKLRRWLDYLGAQMPLPFTA